MNLSSLLRGLLMEPLKTTHCATLLPLESMKPTKTKSIKLFKMLNITEQQFIKARSWYLSAKCNPQKNIRKTTPSV